MFSNDPPEKITQFLHYTRDFFEYHALHYERLYRLYASDYTYRFEYLKDVGQSLPDTTQTQKEEPADPPADDQADTVQVKAAPVWLQPVPQPVLSGPVMKFDQVTFTFATAYDSANLNNTRGSVSLRDGTFVGEKGTFGWSSAGIGATVCCLNSVSIISTSTNLM